MSELAEKEPVAKPARRWQGQLPFQRLKALATQSSQAQLETVSKDNYLKTNTL